MRTIFLYLLVIFPFRSICQKGNEESWNPLLTKEAKGSLKNELTDLHEIIFPFRSIKILDCRFDTTKLGYSNHNTHSLSDRMRDNYERVILKGGVGAAIENFYNNYYKNCFDSSQYSLLIVLKRLWIDHDETNYLPGKKEYLAYGSLANIYFKFEYYIFKNEDYLPVKRVDTIFQLMPDNDLGITEINTNKQIDYLGNILKTTIENIPFEKYVKAFDKASKIKIDEIDKFNDSRFNEPILHDTVLKAGVYRDFKEFLANSPSINDFRILQPKDVFGKRYVIIKNDTLSLDNYWGYSDGKNIYEGAYGHQMFRIGNTFDFYRTRTTINHVSNGLNGEDLTSSVIAGMGVQPQLIRPIITPNATISNVPYQIDMETGYIY